MPASRRQILHTGLITGVTGLSGCLFTSDACSEGRTLHETDLSLSSSAQWPTYQYDAANTGHNPDASGPTEEPMVAWRYSSCTTNDSGAIVSGSTAYAGGRVFDATTGHANNGEWHLHMSTPTVTNGTLYVGAFDLEARDAVTGDLEWTFQTDVDQGALPAPTVAGGTVYVAGSIDDRTLYAIDAASGDERWRFETAGDVRSPVAVAARTVYAVDDENTLYALEAATSEERWQESFDADAWRAPPVVGEDHLYVCMWDSTVQALNVTDGSRAWRQSIQSPGRLSEPVALADGTVITAGEKGTINALNAGDGRIEWTKQIPETALAPPAIADGTVFIGADGGGNRGVLFALDATTGEEYWRLETRGVDFGDHTPIGIPKGPAVVDEYVFVTTAPGELYTVTGR